MGKSIGNPKVSVIIPVYNTGKYVEEAVYSIMNQTLSELEIIIVNDGSTDNTVEVVNNIIDKSKIPIKFIDKPNGGKHSAWRVAKKFLKVVM